MSVYYKTDKGVLFQGDCLEVMQIIPDKSIDAIITDLPLTRCNYT
jgi:predicted methyltransferase